MDKEEGVFAFENKTERKESLISLTGHDKITEDRHTYGDEGPFDFLHGTGQNTDGRGSSIWYVSQDKTQRGRSLWYLEYGRVNAADSFWRLIVDVFPPDPQYSQRKKDRHKQCWSTEPKWRTFCNSLVILVCQEVKNFIFFFLLILCCHFLSTSFKREMTDFNEIHGPPFCGFGQTWS